MPTGRDTPGEAAPVYRAYEIGEDDRVVSSQVVEAQSDGAAIRKLHDLADGRLMELWDRGRLVARIPREPKAR